jgi:predicted nucleotidyltransferase
MTSYTDNYRDIIVPIILKHLPNAKIILYGSRARKQERPGSDIDVAIDMGSKIDDHTMALIRGDIEESSLPILFDIVDFYAVSEDMVEAIKKDGVIWRE